MIMKQHTGVGYPAPVCFYDTAYWYFQFYFRDNIMASSQYFGIFMPFTYSE